MLYELWVTATLVPSVHRRWFRVPAVEKALVERITIVSAACEAVSSGR